MIQYSVFCYTQSNPNEAILIADKLPTPASARNIAKCLMTIPDTLFIRAEVWAIPKTPGHKIDTFKKDAEVACPSHPIRIDGEDICRAEGDGINAPI